MKRVLVAAAAVALLAAATSGAQASAPTLAATATQLLSFDHLPGLDRLISTAASPTATMVVGVGLQNPYVAAEQALYARLYNPGDPLFHQFLTPAQVGARFGIPAAQRAAATHALTSAGLRIIQTSAEGDWFAAEGTVTQVQRALQVHIRAFTAHGRNFLANLEGPTVPVLAHVMTVVGLDTWQRWSVPAHTLNVSDACGICTGTLTPQMLWSIYNQPSRYTGQGQSMAIIGEGNPANTIAALPTFEQHFGLPHRTLKVVCVQDHSCGTDTSGDAEWLIDTQASTGMAPRAQETLYFAQGLEDPKLDMALLAWINDPHGAHQASASESVCEQTPLNAVWRGPLEGINGNDNYLLPVSLALGDDQQPVIDQALRHASLEGRTLFAAAGDTGFTCGAVLLPAVGAGNGYLYNGTPQVGYPSSSPYAVGVGGTVLYYDSTRTRRALEYAWPYTGGGTSFFQPAPAYQHGQPNVIGHCLSSPSNLATGNGPLCRGVPDVAALSGDVIGNGYLVADQSGCCASGGGTSLSSPLWLGMWTRAQTAAAMAGAPGGLGFANETFYALGNNGVTRAHDFYDITLGFNGYPALTGWDYTSGFGPPQLTNLVSDALARAHLRPKP